MKRRNKIILASDSVKRTMSAIKICSVMEKRKKRTALKMIMEGRAERPMAAQFVGDLPTTDPMTILMLKDDAVLVEEKGNKKSLTSASRRLEISLDWFWQNGCATACWSLPQFSASEKSIFFLAVSTRSTRTLTASPIR